MGCFCAGNFRWEKGLCIWYKPIQSFRLPLISNQFIQPLFKTNQFFFELSKLTSLNEGRKRDLNEKLFTARVALWNSDPNTKNPVEVAVSKRDPNTKNPVGVALSKRDPCCKKFHMGRPLKERPIWVILKKKIQKSENIISKGDPYYLYYNIL